MHVLGLRRPRSSPAHPCRRAGRSRPARRRPVRLATRPVPPMPRCTSRPISASNACGQEVGGAVLAKAGFRKPVQRVPPAHHLAVEVGVRVHPGPPSQTAAAVAWAGRQSACRRNTACALSPTRLAYRSGAVAPSVLMKSTRASASSPACAHRAADPGAAPAAPPARPRRIRQPRPECPARCPAPAAASLPLGRLVLDRHEEIDAPAAGSARPAGRFRRRPGRPSPNRPLPVARVGGPAARSAAGSRPARARRR
jgi:hypothetical protein